MMFYSSGSQHYKTNSFSRILKANLGIFVVGISLGFADNDKRRRNMNQAKHVTNGHSLY